MASKAVHLLGRCLPFFPGKSVANATRVQIRKLQLDDSINMYFPEDTTIFVHDPGQQCKPGDIVLIKSLPKKLTPLIEHEVHRVVYPFGDIKDPITGKKVVSDMYREDIEFVSEMYGKNKDSFNYEEAPERGWQEDKKDFSHKQSYRRFHVYDKEDKQPYAVDH
ncbi:small ribosomal subunit protein uS17m [Neocloeon triangulifer]|uniref:small ribosomal subunit protein uS17m n=1 Tax=Neocloeon triangulifer TaxID=2078957 RepID=UPI00286FAEF1|nr:small ribosomal subunit protein uS17m [Neocloeon triangulifer]